MYRLLKLLCYPAVLVLAGCDVPGAASRDAPGADPVSALLDRADLTFAYDDGSSCTLRAPANEPVGESWTSGDVDCPGIVAVEVTVFETAPEAVILRMWDGGGPLTLRGLPPVHSVEVWAAMEDGLWAHFGALGR